MVYLLTIDMREVTGDPSHVLRFINNYGEDGTGVAYQGNLYTPHPYEIKQVKRTAKSNKTGAKVLLSDNEDLTITRFIDRVAIFAVTVSVPSETSKVKFTSPLKFSFGAKL